MSKILLKYERTCKGCSSTDNGKFSWHHDRWGGKEQIGWYCHWCYNAIDSVETRGRYNKRPRGNKRPSGLKYTTTKK